MIRNNQTLFFALVDYCDNNCREQETLQKINFSATKMNVSFEALITDFQSNRKDWDSRNTSTYDWCKVE